MNTSYSSTADPQRIKIFYTNSLFLFSASSTKKFLRDSGVLTCSQKVWTSAKLYSQNGLKYIEASFPDYYKATVEFTAPYIKLGGDVYIVAKNVSIKLYENVATYVTEKTPVVLATVSTFLIILLNFFEFRELRNFIRLYVKIVGKILMKF